MRRVGVLFVLLAACGGGGDSASPTSTVPCLRVSNVFRANLRMSVPSALSAVQDGDVWYVSSADGATWQTSADPTLGTIESGFIHPVNDAALQVSAYGSANGVSAGFDGSAAAASRTCALKAEG